MRISDWSSDVCSSDLLAAFDDDQPRGDDVDRALVALLVRRFGYMDAAARIKSARAAVRDEERKAQVLDNVAPTGAAAGLDPDRLRVIWNELVEQSIAHEFDRWDGTRS